MSTIRLAVNDQLEEVMTYLEREYKPMSRAEILKMGLSELMHKAKQRRVEVLDQSHSKHLEEGFKDMAEGKYKSFSNIDDLIEDLDN